jgi:adenylate cyclase
MDALGPSDIFLFEDFRLDWRGLFRRDQAGVFVPVKIGSRAFDLLQMLIERRGELVSKDELVAAVWPGTVVEEGNLTVQISTLRGIVDKSEAGVGCIQTVAGRGYRFVAPVMRHPADTRSSTATPEIGARSIPRLCIVVLPFANFDNDPEQQYFADAMTDDLTTDLSRLAGLFVISRSTAFTYKDKPVNARQIGRDLSVRYVLEGTVRRSGDRIRINAQLIDAETDTHLWAERFDTDLGDLLALQNEITGRIAVALDMELLGAEAARPTSRPDVQDCILRGRAEGLKPPSRDRYPEAIRLFERALALDPHSVEAQSYLASVLMARVTGSMSDSPVADIARAEGLARQALASSPRSPLAHYAKAQVLRAQHRHSEAIPEYETVLAFNRNRVHALSGLAICKGATGSLEEVIPLFEQAIRLSPRDPQIGVWYDNIGVVHLLDSRVEDALLWLEKARTAMPEHVLPHAHLASAYALKGETERAAAELAEARRLSLDDRYASLARLTTAAYWGVPSVRALYEATYFAGLKKAGLPE